MKTLHDFREFLRSQGYFVDDDDLWMEDCVQDHKYRDLFEMFQQFQQFRESSSPTVKESYKKEIITNLLKEILAEEDLDHLCCPACGDNLGLTFKYALKTWIEIQHLNKP